MLKDDIIKHRLNPIKANKTFVKHQLRVNKGHVHLQSSLYEKLIYI